MNDQKQPCPRCGLPITEDSPGGLCPACLMADASTPTESGQKSPNFTTPPSIQELTQAFPNLEIMELIGRGGMGYVFRARQPKLDRNVAIKILPKEFASDPTFEERFTREGRLLAHLNHPNIVTIHDFGEAKGYFYILMELVDGVNLRQAMQAGRFSPDQALAVVPHICEALQYAHDHGVLHRDIKPENILIDTKGRVKIADFGIAKMTETEVKEAGLTLSGSALGTPQYMAPEQIENPSTVDHRADIYSLGVVLYELLTGELPIGRFSAPSSKSPMNPKVDEVVFRALEKEREKRQQSAGQLKTEVETVGKTSQVRKPQKSWENKWADSNRTIYDNHSCNPWPLRLFWLILCVFVLPVLILMIALIVPMLSQQGSSPNNILLFGGAIFLSMIVMVWLVRNKLTNSGTERTQPKDWNPWPKRIFLAILILLGVPLCLLVIMILLPLIAWQV